MKPNVVAIVIVLMACACLTECVDPADDVITHNDVAEMGTMLKKLDKLMNEEWSHKYKYIAQPYNIEAIQKAAAIGEEVKDLANKIADKFGAKFEAIGIALRDKYKLDPKIVDQFKKLAKKVQEIKKEL
jgi:hypothetical protein